MTTMGSSVDSAWTSKEFLSLKAVEEKLHSLKFMKQKINKENIISKNHETISVGKHTCIGNSRRRKREQNKYLK